MDYKSRAAVYLRKSRGDDESETIGETLARHEKILTEYALKSGVTIVKTYKEVVSGDGLFTRPEMLSLLRDVEKGEYTAVLCVDIDRLGRSSTKDTGIILESLRENGVRIITPDKTYDLDDEIDEMTVEMKSFFARQELKAIKKRLHRGEIETLKAGGHTGEPPYGYRRAWLNKLPTLEIVPEEAEVIRIIYDRYINRGEGCYIISEYLNSMGIPAPDGGKFSRTSVGMILSNPTYTGKIVWNRTRRIKKRRPEDKFKEVANPPELWLEAKGLHEAIVSEEDWNEAQRIRTSRAHPPSYKGIIKTPYSGLIFCANCGAALQRQCTKRGGERVLCPTKGCTSSVSMKLFNDRIKAALKEELEGLKLNYNKKPDNDTGAEREKKLLETQKRTVAAQRSRLHDLLEQGIYDTATFMERQAELIKRQTSIESELKRLTDEIGANANKLTREEAIPIIEELLANWDTAEPTKINSILRTIINRITYTRPSLTPNFTLQIEWLV